MVDVAGEPHEFVVVDVETTGLYWRRDRVVSVAVARCDGNGLPLSQWYSLVNPGCPMGASEIHGLTDASVAHAPSFEHVADELLGQLGGAVLVGHNVTFDWRFLSGEYSRAGETLPEHDAICTLGLARALELHAENLKLDTLAAYCQVPLPRAQFHDAREDVLATAGVFAQLYPLALARGINPLMHLAPELPPALRKTAKCAYVNPGRLPPGGPLIQGMHVAITGETITPREELYARSLRAGLDVLNGVNSKTSLLVTNDLSTGTGKARAAIALGIPVVDEANYLCLISSVAPGTAKEQLANQARVRKAARVQPAGEPIAVSGPLAGRRVVLLGEIEDRAHLEELVTHSGGVVSHNVSKNISLVVLGVAYETVRLENAVGYGAEVLTSAELLAKLHAGEDLRGDDPQEDSDVADEAAAVLDESPPEPVASAAQSAVEVVITPAAPSLPPAAWHPDPSGRYQYRYWDGARWGPYVANNGQTYIDPIG
jgi:DNA polymerase-3 subunit epsilon